MWSYFSVFTVSLPLLFRDHLDLLEFKGPLAIQDPMYVLNNNNRIQNSSHENIFASFGYGGDETWCNLSVHFRVQMVSQVHVDNKA